LDGTTVAANASRHRLLKLETVEERLTILEQEIAEEEMVEGVAPAVEMQQPAASPITAVTSSSLQAESDALETVEERLAILVQEIAKEEMVEGAAPAVEMQQSAASPITATTLTSVEAENPATNSRWKAKTLRGKKRQRAHYRQAQAVLRAKHQANVQRRKDKRKKNNRIRVALGDPTAPFGLDKLKTYRPLYNVQTMSDVGTDFVFAYETTATTVDNGQLLPMIGRTTEATNRPLETVLVDSGYPSGEDLAQCKKKEVVVYAPWNENSFTEAKRAKAGKERQIPKDQFTFDPSVPGYRCPEGKMLTYSERTKKQRANGDYVTLEIYQADRSDCGACPLTARCVQGRSGARTVRRQEHEELIDELKERMKQPEAKRIYRQRGCTVERRFADMKTHRGLQRFSGRTQERADTQVGLTVLAHNLVTLDKLRTTRRESEENAGKMAS
jgi:hypothetical protein